MAAWSPLYHMPPRSILQEQEIEPVATGPKPTFVLCAANGSNVPIVLVSAIHGLRRIMLESAIF